MVALLVVVLMEHQPSRWESACSWSFDLTGVWETAGSEEGGVSVTRHQFLAVCLGWEAG